MLFRKGDYSNSEYKQIFKEHIEVLETYNGGVLFGNSPVATVREIVTLGLDAEIKTDVEKLQVSARGKYLATAFLISSDRRWYGELILSLNNDYAKQQKNYPKTLPDVYGLMVEFDPTRSTPVSGGQNKGMDSGNVAVEPRSGGTGIMVAAAARLERLIVGTVGGTT